MSFIKICLTAAMVAAPAGLGAQQTLTLDQCREMAVSSNKALEQAGTKVEMAGYDRKIAFA
ncbi:MAG: alkaline protease, partial [Bacteroidales bacterium]|nr:alkaline protease [Bacteroidales bacterium]